MEGFFNNNQGSLENAEGLTARRNSNSSDGGSRTLPFLTSGEDSSQSAHNPDTNQAEIRRARSLQALEEAIKRLTS
jgi:hypothetical protein